MAALVAAAAFASAAGAAEPAKPAAAAGAWKPAETADAVLIQENVSWQRHLHDALGLPEWIDLAIEHRTRFEYLGNSFRPGEPSTQTQYPQRTRLRLGLDGPGPLRFLAEIQDARTWGDGPRDFTVLMENKVDVLQLLVAATTKDLLGSGLRGDLHLGRMTLDVASRRLVARNSFRNTTNAFDGGHVQIGDGKDWRLRGFFVLPVLPKPGYLDDDPSTRALFWGVAAEAKRAAWLELEIYYLGLHDRILRRDYSTYGVRGLRRPKPAQLDYELELIGQFGERGRQDHTAFASHAALGYTLDAPWKPRLVAQLDYASGTEDPNGDASHGFDPLFGARRFDLNPTGIFGAFRRSNILSPGVRVVVSPLETVRAQVKVRHWQLAEKRDAFSGTGLRDRSGDSGRQLGQDVELSAQWTPAPWLTLDVGYDHWFKGSYMDEVPGTPTRDDTDYAYVSALVRF